MNRTLTRVAMATAAVMLAHQVGAKAFRDALFLRAWPATALPLMSIATAALTGVVVPIVSTLFARFSPATIVAGGFALSASAHLVEWRFYDAGRPIAVVIFLHLAVAGAVLLSGFWSLVAERYDPAGARASYSRITAAGTVGGIAGSIAAERIATMIAPDAVLIALAMLHTLCAVGVIVMQRTPVLLGRPSQAEQMSSVRDAFRSPYVRTIAAFVMLTGAAAAVLDFLLKTSARTAFGTGPELLRFFALFYGTVQVVTFFAQAASGGVIRRFGVNGTINALPAGVGAMSAIAAMIPGVPVLTALRGTEAVLRASLFRGGYELLFVPMDAAVRRRAKAVLDVVCDRAGEALGSALVQLLLVLGVASIGNSLLRASLFLSLAALWIGQRFGGLYLHVVEDQLVKYREAPPVSLVSEAGWTVLHLPTDPSVAHVDGPPPARREARRAARVDSQIEMIADLRSRDVTRVMAAVARRASFERIHVAQTINLLAWDEVLPAVRDSLEELAPRHLGMLVDAMLDPATDFAIRRRLPRILGMVASRRSLDGLTSGLNDPRFEVRYHASRAINRILMKNDELSVDRARVIAVVERELAVPPQLWRGYRLLDRPEEPGTPTVPAEAGSRQIEYVFLLLSTIIAREPLDAAVHGVSSPNPGVRGLAIEYLDQVLPAAVLERLRAMIASTPFDADAHEQSGSPPTAR